MTKFDIRLRRKQFTQSRIERYKNYQSLMERHTQARKRKTHGIIVLAFLVILIIAILLAFFNAPDKPRDSKEKENVSHRFNQKSKNSIEQKSTVYKL